MSKSPQGEDGRRAQQLFDALTQAAEVAGISVTVTRTTDTGASVIYVNDVALKLLDVSREEIAVRSVWSFIAPDELPKLLEMHRRTQRGEPNPTRFETTLVQDGGKRVPVEIATHRVVLDGHLANVTFLTDASHRKHAEDALRRSEALFRTLAQSAPDGIAILRFPKILYANERAVALMGAGSMEEAIGMSLLDVLEPEDAQKAQERAARRRNGESVSDAVEYTIRRNGRAIEVRATPIEYEGLPATLGFARDVTDRKELLERLMQAEKLAALGTLAAGVAHEINNPLAYLLLSLDMLERQLPRLPDDPSLLPQLMRLIADAKHGGTRVKTIVRDLQTFTRRDNAQIVPVQLAAAIDGALTIAAHELRHVPALARRLEPVPHVLGHPARFEQLFLNLILNALHAIEGLPEERRVIELAVRPGRNDTVVATVRDEGYGMSEETRARAAEPFFTTKALGLGTGLGLSICQSIAHAAGGDISVQSELDRGTTVTLTLPAYRGEMAEKRRSSPPAVGKAPRRASILIVDDERAVASSLAAALADEHDVTTCNSVAEAREALEEKSDYDVILCDVVMPAEGGPVLLDHVRARHPELAQRFAFMTGGASLPIAEQLRIETTYPQLEKPFELDAVRALIGKVVKQKDQSRPPGASPLIARARELAVHAHASQKYGDRPYTVHLEAVQAVLERFGIASEVIRAAAWLHDVLEDSPTTQRADLERYFPEEIVAIVDACTDGPGQSRAERKQRSLKLIARTQSAIIVKLADRIANVEASVHGNQTDKLATYREEHKHFAEKLRGSPSDFPADPMWQHLDKLLG